MTTAVERTYLRMCGCVSSVQEGLFSVCKRDSSQCTRGTLRSVLFLVCNTLLGE